MPSRGAEEVMHCTLTLSRECGLGNADSTAFNALKRTAALTAPSAMAAARRQKVGLSGQEVQIHFRGPIRFLGGLLLM